MSAEFERELLSDLGFDIDDPKVAAALEDSELHARLVATLVRLRDDRDLKQDEVAKRMGTTQSRVSSFERLGGDPRLSTVLRYARAVDSKVKFVVQAAPRGWDLAETRTMREQKDGKRAVAGAPPGEWETVRRVAG